MIVLLLLALVSLFLACPVTVLAYTPLVASTDFDGIKADVLTTATGIITVLLIIVGLGILVKVLGR